MSLSEIQQIMNMYCVFQKRLHTVASAYDHLSYGLSLSLEAYTVKIKYKMTEV